MGIVRTGDDLPEACPKCHSPIRREFNFCPSCGERLHETCPQCRAVLEPGWRFCPTCGLTVGGQEVMPYLTPDQGLEMGQRAEAHNTRGSELYDNDEYEEAIREFSTAISLSPNNPLYHTNLAVALSETGEFERAVSEFQTALRLDPNNAAAYLQLGYTYQEMERPMQAVEAWRKVIDLAPDSPEAGEARNELNSI